MDSNDLTRDQGLKVFLETREILGRIYAIVDRMKQRGFPPDDPLYVSTVTA